jgi:signal transduction histidine kinase
MNAIKYHNSYRPNPFISIDASADVDSVTIEIADNGEGIKAEYQQKIFNMFFRGTEKSKGSGLGLYIARETVEKLKGTITVESTYSEGSKFIVTLPQPAIGSLKQTNAKEVLTENAPDRSIG